MVDRTSADSGTRLFLSPNPAIIYPRSQIPRLGGTLNLTMDQGVGVINSKDTLNIYPAATIPTSFLQGANQLSITIPPSAVFLKHLRIELTVTNTSGANPVSVLPVPLWFNSINVQGNSGNLILQQWTSPASLFLTQICNITDEKLIAIAPALNIDATNPANQATTASIPAGATVKFYMDLADAFWELVPLWMGDLQGNLIINLYSSPNTAFDVTTGAGAITSINLINCRALATVVQPAQEQVNYMSTQTVRDNQFLSQTVTTQQMTLSANTQYTVRMSGNQGYCPWIWVITRGPLPLASSPAAARNWPDITKSIQILDSTGNPIVQQVDEQYLSSFMASDYWAGCQIFNEIGGVTQWSFALSPSLIFDSGIVMGGYSFTSNEQYQFTTEASTTSGTYEVSIICPVYSVLRIKNGTFSVFNS